MDDFTPTCVIVTIDTTLNSGNVKLFINGKLEDLTGKATTDGSTNNWKKGAELDINTDGVVQHEGITLTLDEFDPLLEDEVSIGAVCGGFNKENNTFPYVGKFCGKIEDLVYYPITIYPVDPARGEYVLDKPLSELQSDEEGVSKSLNARLFIKDYHNIRGKTKKDIGMSGPQFIRKSAPVLDGRSN